LAAPAVAAVVEVTFFGLVFCFIQTTQKYLFKFFFVECWTFYMFTCTVLFVKFVKHFIVWKEPESLIKKPHHLGPRKYCTVLNV
jgi:hypothetical protein